MNKLLLIFFLGCSFGLMAANPTVQASNVLLVNRTCRSAAIHWTTGNGQYSLVTCRPHWQPKNDPIDGQVFFVNSFYGKGSSGGDENYGVFFGTDSNVNISGLLEDSVYIIQVYAVNAPPFQYFSGNPPTLKVQTYKLSFSISAIVENACRGKNKVNFKLNAKGPPELNHYLWLFPDSVFSSQNQMERHFKRSGFVTVSAKLLPDYGCKEQKSSKTIYIIPGINYASILAQNAACILQKVILKDTIDFDLVSGAGYTRKWIVPSGDSFKTSKIIQTFSKPGLYTFKEIIYSNFNNGFTGCSDTFSSVVRIYDNPKLKLNGDTCISDFEPLKWVAPLGFLHYNWQEKSQLPFYFLQQPGWIKLTVTDSNACMATDSVFVPKCNEPVYLKWQNLANLENNYSAFPNPANQNLYIQTNVLDFEVFLFNTSGTLVYNGFNKHTIPLANLKDGVYALTIKGKQGFFSNQIHILH